MQKTTHKTLGNKLGAYTAMAASIAGIADASGQILYTDIADQTVNPGDVVYIDVDQNGVGEFRFITNSAGNFNFMQAVSSDNDTAYNSNAFAGVTSFGYEYPTNFNAGDVIGPSFTPPISWQVNARGDMNYASCAYPNSDFCDGNDGYVALRLEINGNTHYGWARVQVAANNSSIIIKDFAYNTVADDTIEAGETDTLSLDEVTIDKRKVISINDKIELFNLEGTTKYNVYDLSGKVVLSGSTNDTNYSIPASSLSTGVYIVELQDNQNSSSLMRKKIVL